MMDKMKDIAIVVCIAAVIFAAGYVTNGLLNRNSGTVIVGKTLSFFVPGGTDTTKHPVTEMPIPKDSAEVRDLLNKVDSLQRYISSLPANKRDSANVSRNAAYQIVVEDSVSINYVRIDPLAPIGLRARVDSTHYKSLQLSFIVMDTTLIVKKGIGFQTYVTVTGGAAVGAAIAGPAGAGAGAAIAIIIDDWL